MLAKQMKVQGAVVLQVLIGKQGNIQNLQVLSGPAILSTAAREAVLQWCFKQYYVSGQTVETEARVTVNFTISTQCEIHSARTGCASKTQLSTFSAELQSS